MIVCIQIRNSTKTTGLFIHQTHRFIAVKEYLRPTLCQIAKIFPRMVNGGGNGGSFLDHKDVNISAIRITDLITMVIDDSDDISN